MTCPSAPSLPIALPVDTPGCCSPSCCDFQANFAGKTMTVLMDLVSSFGTSLAFTATLSHQVDGIFAGTVTFTSKGNPSGLGGCPEVPSPIAVPSPEACTAVVQCQDISGVKVYTMNIGFGASVYSASAAMYLQSLLANGGYPVGCDGSGQANVFTSSYVTQCASGAAESHLCLTHYANPGCSGGPTGLESENYSISWSIA